MHRLAAIPGVVDDGGVAFVEQEAAPVLLLTSADTDLLCLEPLLQAEPELLGAELRALNLAALAHPAVVDHYLARTAAAARLVVVRLLGGRGHWSYGLERLGHWAQARPGRQLLVLAGTAEEERSLAELGTGDPALAVALARCLRVGGPGNGRVVLATLGALLRGESPAPPEPQPLADPLPHDWRDEPGERIGVIAYRALWQAGDLELMDALLEQLRQRDLCPRALWVSGLRDGAVQRGVEQLLAREQVQAVLCCTSFASVQFEQAGLGAPLWEALDVPVLQLLSSSQPRQRWLGSSIGLSPTDLTLQVALPELDGRITTRLGAFKECVGTGELLGGALQRYRPDWERLAWVCQLAANWIALRCTPAAQRQVALVLANYPARNSRLANGVGLDTPASAAAMLHWLRAEGYGLAGELPADGQTLIEALLAGRSNDPESGHRPALDHLPLAVYRAWYDGLPADGRQRLEAVWGPPEQDAGLERLAGGGQGFAVRGLRFGSVCLLIQPERGYDRDPSLSYHSPDLPPTHAYLAQYLWLRQVFAAQAVMHVGKHGNLEWLPGKGLGLSDQCYPEWALGPLPHLYPFIVNDPGEGSQAKRRSQAVILDHLTPPLGCSSWRPCWMSTGRPARWAALSGRPCCAVSWRSGSPSWTCPWARGPTWRPAWTRPMATCASSRRPRSGWVCTATASCRSRRSWRNCCSAWPGRPRRDWPASPRPWPGTRDWSSTPGPIPRSSPWASPIGRPWHRRGGWATGWSGWRGRPWSSAGGPWPRPPLNGRCPRGSALHPPWRSPW